MKIGRGARQRCCFSAILLNLHRDYLTKRALEEFECSQLRQAIRTVKYANDHVLLAVEETMLQGMIDKLTEII
jgi:hypothetical protein